MRRRGTLRRLALPAMPHIAAMFQERGAAAIAAGSSGWRVRQSFSNNLSNLIPKNTFRCGWASGKRSYGPPTQQSRREVNHFLAPCRQRGGTASSGMPLSPVSQKTCATGRLGPEDVANRVRPGRLDADRGVELHRRLTLRTTWLVLHERLS